MSPRLRSCRGERRLPRCKPNAVRPYTLRRFVVAQWALRPSIEVLLRVAGLLRTSLYIAATRRWATQPPPGANAIFRVLLDCSVDCEWTTSVGVRAASGPSA